MSLTLLQAITHCKEKAAQLRQDCLSVPSNLACAAEHEQLAHWLAALHGYEEGGSSKADYFIAGFICAGGEVEEARRQAVQFELCVSITEKSNG